MNPVEISLIKGQKRGEEVMVMPTMCVSLFSYVGLIYKGLSPTLTHPTTQAPRRSMLENSCMNLQQNVPPSICFRDFDRMLPLDVSICFRTVGSFNISCRVVRMRMTNVQYHITSLFGTLILQLVLFFFFMFD